MNYLDVVERTWPVLNRLMKGHTAVYRASRGLVGHRVPFAPPMLLLDHVGAKSGRKRTIPLVYMRDGDNYVLVASKGGNPKNPAWFHNLKANPETTIQVGPRRFVVKAKVASPQKRAALWPKVVEHYGGYAEYQKRTERKIPLVILEPQ